MKQILFTKMMLLACLAACCQSPNSWTRIADFGGPQRFAAVSFSIGSKGYVGTGFSLTIFFTPYKDFWAYDTATGAWTQVADFGGSARGSAVGFNIGNKGYAGTGSTGQTKFKDFWEYDPTTNTWIQKADFGGGVRTDAGGFSIGSKGYIGTGDTTDAAISTKDFWEYDPATDTWVQKADFSGAARLATFGLAIGNKGYFLGGVVNGGYDKDFWEYDPVTDNWVQKADYGGGYVSGPAGFAIGNKGYVGTGDYIIGNEFWEYDPATGVWTQKASLANFDRSYAVGFSIGNNGYIGSGLNSETGTVNDFWKYQPSAACGIPTNLKVPAVTSHAAALRWIPPADPVDAFDISYHIYNDATVLTRHKPGNSSHIILTGLHPCTTYQWSIRSNCGADTTDWVMGPDFKTLPLTVSELKATTLAMDEQVQVLPNPNNGNFVLQMQLPEKTISTTITIYNNVGIKLWQQNAGMLSGSVARKLSLQDQLQKGIYLIVIERNDKKLIQRLVVMK